MRKQAKEYGTCKLAEGPDVAGRRVTLVEDVITTGGAVRDATRALRAAGAVVEVVVCAIDRSPEGQNPLADVGLEVRPVLTKAQLDAVRKSPEPASRSLFGVALAAVLPPLVGDRDHREGQDRDDRLVDVVAQRGERAPRK